MPFTMEKYLGLRPFLYHLTSRQGAESLLVTSVPNLFSAAKLIEMAGGDPDVLKKQRRVETSVVVDGREVALRDQKPLTFGNVEFQGGWTRERLVEEINRRVFFWAGNEKGPVDYGTRHFGRFKAERPVILRMRLKSLLASNPKGVPEFCRYNSGSPRCCNGRKSPRGPDLYLPIGAVPWNAGEVVEVTFIDHVVIPRDCECSDSPEGPWKPFFVDAIV